MNNSLWQALHIFIPDPVLQNKFLIEVVQPHIQALRSSGRISQWFFMKYWEGGPHIRLRVKEISSIDFVALKHALLTEVAHYQTDNTLTREAFYKHNKFDGEALDADALPWFEPGSVEEITYQPELDRYGGEYAMPVSEQLFCASSEFALDILSRSLETTNDKITLAFDLLLMGSSHLNPEQKSPASLQKFFTQYAKFYARFIHDIQPIDDNLQQFFRNNKELLINKMSNVLSGNFNNKYLSNTAVDAWQSALAGTHKNWLALIAKGQLITPYFKQSANSPQMREIAVASLASSHLHMLNNRLSIIPAFEYQAAILLSLAAGGVSHD